MRPCICRSTPGYWERLHIRLLTPEEEAHAFAIGDKRYLRATKGQWRDYLGEPSVDSHRIGASGELAFCIAMGVEWGATIDSFRDHPDVEPDFEVRTARKPFLKLRPDDPSDSRTSGRRYVLLTPGRADFVGEGHVGASFILHGWIRGFEAIGERMSDPGHRGKPAYFIEPARLHRFPLDAPHHEPKAEAAKDSTKLVLNADGKYEVAA